MFTGIVREVGRIVSVEGGAGGVALRVEAPVTASVTAVGDSVAIDGVCLTAESAADGAIAFHAVPETLGCTSLGRLVPGDAVNVEPALRAGEPLGGHIVQGHVDATGIVRSVAPEGEGARLLVEAPAELLRYCVKKGSIAVAGVSLTIAELTADTFAVALVPHTLAATTLGAAQPGRVLNLEVDVLAKHVERLLAGRLG
ncbi:MAG: riboflavin synthase [Thermoleophilia bacterium]|nr:riboflavin synthase [Thermoleophilia bacterium]